MGHEEQPSQEETLVLARAAKGGDAKSFERLYERIAPALYTWASLRIRPALRPFLEPQDVVQEVWCRAWRKIRDFDSEGVSLRHWIFRIAKNVLLEAMRKLERTPRISAPGPTTRLFALQNLPDSATNISQRVARSEGVKIILDWVEELDEDERKLFCHCGLEGMPYAEVAERMGLSRDVIAKRWQKLRARIEQFALPDELIAS